MKSCKAFMNHLARRMPGKGRAAGTILLSGIWMSMIFGQAVLPARAEEPPADNGIITSAEPVVLQKSFTADKDREGTITLVQYMTGSVAQTIVPSDIVLVLDQSGSMRFPYRNNDPTIRQNALKESAGQFIRRIGELNRGLPAEHQSRMDIITFGNDAKDLMKGMVTVSGSGEQALADMVSGLQHGSEKTRTDLGLQAANAVLYSDAEKANGHPKTVVLFTDGQPNPEGGHGFQPSTANAALRQAKQLKDAGAKVYVVSIDANTKFSPGEDLPIYERDSRDTDNNPSFFYFDDSQGYDAPTETTNYCKTSDERVGKINSRFLYLLSSDNPEADSLSYEGKTYGVDTSDSYCFQADNAGQLTEAFHTIAQKIDVTASLPDSDSVIRDIVTDDFTLDRTSIRAYSSERAKGTDGTFVWAEPQDITAELTIGQAGDDADSITVSGFDYRGNYVSDTGHADDPEFYGKKLIVTFRITAVKTYGGNGIPTNKPESGLYGKESETPIASYPVPEADLPLQYEISSRDCTVYVPDRVDPEEMVLFTDGYEPDGRVNAYVDIEYSMKNPSGAVIGTRIIQAGEKASDTCWEWKDGIHESGLCHVDCRVAPVKEGTAAPITRTADPRATIFRPVLKLKDTTLDQGAELDFTAKTPIQESQLGPHFLSLSFQSDDGQTASMADAPALSYTAIPGSGCTEKDGHYYMNTEEELPVKLQVFRQVNDQRTEITGETIFRHECSLDNCRFEAIRESDGGSGVRFLIHGKGEKPSVVVKQPPVEIEQPDIHVKSPEVVVDPPVVTMRSADNPAPEQETFQASYRPREPEAAPQAAPEGEVMQPMVRSRIATGDDQSMIAWAVALCVSFGLLVLWMVVPPRKPRSR